MTWNGSANKKDFSAYNVVRIRDNSDHGRSNEPMNPCPELIQWFISSTMIRVISDH